MQTRHAYMYTYPQTYTLTYSLTYSLTQTFTPQGHRVTVAVPSAWAPDWFLKGTLGDVDVARLSVLDLPEPDFSHPEMIKCVNGVGRCRFS